jgi:purine-binding chemotaxis protein CheW
MTDQLYLIAHIAGRGVAIASNQVESAVDIGEITPTPLAPSHIRGLAALRSRVVTVIDTHAALGIAPQSRPAARAVITAVDGHHYAVLVDSLEDVAPFDASPLPPGIALDAGWRVAGCGEVERDGEPILVIDLTALIRGAANSDAITVN